MKNLSLILNAILFVLVGILFYFQFNKKSSEAGTTLPVNTGSPQPGDGPVPVFKNLSNTSGKIVFIDYDSLVQNYELFRKMEKDLENKLKKSEQEILGKQKKLEEDYQSYMQGQAMMTEQHRATKEQQLNNQNQDLIKLREERGRQFANQEQELNQKLLNTLYGYFNKLARQNNFSYIFTYKRGIPGVVFGADSLNITRQVIEGLNAEYKSNNK